MIRIITDSASDISQAESKELGIDVIPLKVNFGEEAFLDGIDIDFDGFYDKLVAAKDLPRTSQIGPFDWAEAIKKYPAEDDILIITLSSGLSGTYQSACMAMEEHKNVRVVDSLNATIGERLVVLRALALLKEGRSIDEIANTLNKETKEICLFGLLDTLEFLKKGGRISSAVAFVGTVLKIKPVVEVKNGKAVLAGKARGSKAGNNKLREKIISCGGVDFSRPIVTAYAGRSDDLIQEYLRDSTDLYEGQTLSIHRVGATIGTHIGPGGIAVAFFRGDSK